MSAIDRYDLAVLGSGEAGKYLAWTLSKAGHRTALVERSMVGGSCPNVACLPSKNIIHSAKVASLARRGTEFGLELSSLATNMAGVQDRKRRMVDALIKVHLDRYEASGVELIMGHGRFVAPKTIGITSQRWRRTGHHRRSRDPEPRHSRKRPHRARSGRRVAHDPRAGARS